MTSPWFLFRNIQNKFQQNTANTSLGKEVRGGDLSRLDVKHRC